MTFHVRTSTHIEKREEVSLTMALQQFVRFFTVMIILLFKGCHLQFLECGRIVETQGKSPGSWPWQVFIINVNSYPTEGSLITDQWVLTLARNVQYYEPSGITVHLGPIETSPNVRLPLEKLICDPGNELCLLKLASPVNLTDQVQPICLASEDSTFYSGTDSWGTGFSAPGTGESNLEIVGNNECQCYHGHLSEDAICAGQKGRGTACLGNWGGALMNKNDSVWIQSGVLSSYEGCSIPTKAGVYVRVTQHQKWINDTVTGTPPGFVTFTSPGTDNDLYFTCFTDTAVPTADPTADPTAVPTADPTTDSTSDPTTDFTADFTADPKYLTTTPVCESLFCGGESLIHFTHFTSLCVLVVSLHVFVGSGGI